MSRKKIYILDTNLIVVNPTVVDDLEDNGIVIPFWVLEEIDKPYDMTTTQRRRYETEKDLRP